MLNFIKGMVVGIGGITPGLSGSVLLVIFGLYEKVVETIGTILNFKNLKKNLLFLIPIILGMGVGVLLFSKVVDFLLNTAEMYTRYTFLGLILGTIPMFYKEVKKKDFKKTYYIYMAIAMVLGLSLFFFRGALFPVTDNPNVFQSIIIGIVAAASAVVPGVDNSAMLSAFGFYESFVSALANLNFAVLIPAAVGVGIGAMGISFVMHKLLKNFYGITFSVIFGLFLSIIPSVLNGSCALGWNFPSAISIGLVVVGFLGAYFLEKLKKEEPEDSELLDKEEVQ